MEEKRFPGGVWPVMLTPFTEENQVDYAALKELVEWYIKNGVDGLFAVCQSSEMFKLTLEERVTVAAKVKEYAAARVPVIASGGCGRLEDFSEVFQKTGADAALAASLFHYRELTVEQVKAHLHQNGIPVRR